MTRHIVGLTTISLLLATTAFADIDYGILEITPETTNQPLFGGQISGWGMAVLPSFALESNRDCVIHPSAPLCENALGYGSDLSLNYLVNRNMSVSTDIFFEQHTSTSGSASHADQRGTYLALGVHLTDTSNPETPWGGFIFGSVLQGNAETDDLGPVVGFGGEAVVSGFTFQAGAAFSTGDPILIDNLKDLFFAGASRDFPLGSGNITAGAVVGFGEFDDDPGQYTNGIWMQASIEYRAPIGSSNFEWFVGYQGDYIAGNENNNTNLDQAVLSALKVGLSMPFGGSDAVFRTPNMRAPLTNAATLN